MSATSWKNRKNAETIQSDLQEEAKNLYRELSTALGVQKQSH
jgi:hypothetical protein